jgi:hypothetical protein
MYTRPGSGAPGARRRQCTHVHRPGPPYVAAQPRHRAKLGRAFNRRPDLVKWRTWPARPASRTSRLGRRNCSLPTRPDRPDLQDWVAQSPAHDSKAMASEPVDGCQAPPTEANGREGEGADRNKARQKADCADPTSERVGRRSEPSKHTR